MIYTKNVDKRQPKAFRFTSEDDACLRCLAARLGVSQTDVLRLALRLLARKEKVSWQKAAAS